MSQRKRDLNTVALLRAVRERDWAGARAILARGNVNVDKVDPTTHENVLGAAVWDAHEDNPAREAAVETALAAVAAGAALDLHVVCPNTANEVVTLLLVVVARGPPRLADAMLAAAKPHELDATTGAALSTHKPLELVHRLLAAHAARRMPPSAIVVTRVVYRGDAGLLAAALAAGGDVNVAVPHPAATAARVVPGPLARLTVAQRRARCAFVDSMRGRDHEFEWAWGNPPLVFAARHAQALVPALLAAGADPNGCNIAGRVPLTDAVALRDAGLVRTLLAAGSDANVQDCAGRTPLFGFFLSASSVPAPPRDAATAAAVIEALRAAGADVNARAKDGTTCVDLAVRDDAPDVLRALVAARADVRSRKPATGRTPMHVAATSGCVRALRVLIDALGEEGLEARDHSDATPLVMAVLAATGATPASDAVRRGALEATHLLLDAGADVNARFTGARSTPLMLAAAVPGAPMPLFEALLRAGTAVDARDASGNTVAAYVAHTMQRAASKAGTDEAQARMLALIKAAPSDAVREALALDAIKAAGVAGAQAAASMRAWVAQGRDLAAAIGVGMGMAGAGSEGQREGEGQEGEDQPHERHDEPAHSVPVVARADAPPEAEGEDQPQERQEERWDKGEAEGEDQPHERLD